MNSRVRLGVLILAISCIVTVGVLAGARPVRASATDNISGYAWSSTVGWTSLNNCMLSTCSGSSYGVSFSKNGGVGSGYAWNSNIGWISFNDQGCPPDIGCTGGTKVDWVNKGSDGSYPIYGWARACAVYDTGCSGELKLDTALGGWDGYIALQGKAVDGSPFGVTLNSNNTITGYGWGADVVGWVKFDGKYGEQAPTLAVDLKANDKDSIEVVPGTAVKLSWKVEGTATSCTASSGWSGSKATNGGSEAVGTVKTRTTYTITCTNAVDTSIDSVIVLIKDDGGSGDGGGGGGGGGGDGDDGGGNPACSDGKDNDKDGTIDYTGGPNGEPADPDCTSPQDTSESSVKPIFIER